MVREEIKRNLDHEGDTVEEMKDRLQYLKNENLSLILPNQWKTRHEFVELVKQLKKNKIHNIQIRLIKQIVNIISINGKKMNMPFPPPLSQSADETSLLVNQCMTQLEIVDLFQQNSNHNKTLIQNEREI